MSTLIRLNAKDNVLVAVVAVEEGQKLEFEGTSFVLPEAVEAGHKLAARLIKKGEDIVKFGLPIGTATQDIPAGTYIHTHNIRTKLDGVLNYRYEPKLHDLPKIEGETFMGYRRENGSVGVRNEIWIVNTVGCVNKTAEILASKASARYADLVDGVQAFAHPFGCSQLGKDHQTTQRILANMVQHPNAAAVLVLGLGCENNNINEFKKVLGTWDEKRVKFLNTQQTADEIEDGLELLGELAQYASGFKRTTIPVSELVIGLKCGGSDGFSGITANPLVGTLSDNIIRRGGTSILTEVPEMFGAETILMERCINEEVFSQTVKLINGFKDYFVRYEQVIYENPSPGNKKGGISTLEEKSLGCTQKGGISNVVDVVPYGGKVSKHGLNLLEGPGNDTVAVTALMAAGAHIVLFTTGRGTPVGAPVPTVKISSNSDLAARKASWIDFDAGVLLAGKSMDELAGDFWNYIVRVASGEKTRNEINGYREISIFKDGVTL